MHQEISRSDIVRARSPHELFLINLIFNHVFLLIAALMATSLRGTVLIVPIVSAAILGYTIWRARRSQDRDPWFVVCHWQIAAKRSVFFAVMWVVAGAVILGLLAISGGDLKPGHYAVGGVFGVPVMGTMLVLIIMESEAMQQASNGTLPKWALERYPRQEVIAEQPESASPR
ncbi:hypothetical protein [Thiohalomonas denitrificans]|uniref:Uncharacterized protein n=1 Tax=Thiohalomonas denitrificans TaxID=415747 RepID=A0A1G5PHR3_9GAMM|nr:hypothetical protein [Thiohalomonas denitrificans]SCZ49055.1 hypothetical protein SAMN03097708_00011 [Thiohalomonas denitrificans]